VTLAFDQGQIIIAVLRYKFRDAHAANSYHPTTVNDVLVR
jgi:hypothetical protein